MKKNIAVLPGDGVGPEVTMEAVKVLEKIAEKFNHKFIFKEGLIGAIAIDKTGTPYPDETHQLCLKSDAVLFGAIGDPKYDNDPKAKVRPEQGLLKMRKSLDLYVNLRPIKTFPFLINQSPLKPEIIKGVDFIFVRELTGGIYFGKPRGRRKNGEEAFDTSTYSRKEIIRVAKIAFDLAMKRNRKITVVDKANVLETSRLWRETVQDQMTNNSSPITIEYMFVDNAAMQIIKNPRQFDVILTENMFGDILPDEASVITGSIGMLPSTSIGDKIALYEPIHGSYPKATGKNTANPIGSILSTAMMLDYSFGLKKESQAVYNAVEKTLNNGLGTKDIVDKDPLSTSDLGNAIINFI
ncbi:MAG: 3-isopropylmalate dehydrogenase [Candidatus Roizmanbacteria bacterium GW2011_GWC2_37_13]|uniref:3-isopropylmalate dehydrogenase n=1 Tax=Candidatus Roizmanbacteria bacterium GW2011_GWC2_37_13 TaxID=1618486 RepID=A0A0G0G1T2_9BACT|nr:MAG: 3-isopropylmalate dehydrogenase [Candidatus Roizmanbacteria bacterium GW2011_GWC2_37_13]KKQ24541.1 MAG: 3-isopropylmalate dehydrogenase [Candidatus Roizmanbacteria bacterium GW2011_GWC1_37_12]